MGRFAVFIIMVSALPGVAEEVDVRALVESAQRAYDEQRFEDALADFQAAREQMPESMELRYNEALTRFRLGQLDEAKALFGDVLETRDAQLEAKAKYNMGDAAYAAALDQVRSSRAGTAMPQGAIRQQGDDLKNAQKLLEESISYFADSLALDPRDEDARTNIELAQRLIEQLQQMQQEQQNQQQEQQDQQESSDNQQQQSQSSDESQQQSSSSQEQESSDTDSQEQEQEQPSEDQQQSNPVEKDQQQQQASQDEQQQSDSEPQPAPEDLTRQEAERMLQAVRDKEKQRNEEMAERRRARRMAVERDW